MKFATVAARFFVPGFIVSLIYFFRFRCFVSPKAEVELSGRLTIGKGTLISSYCKIKATPGTNVIGKNVSIGSGCFIGNGELGIEIGDHVLIGPNCTVLASTYNTLELSTPFQQQGMSSKGTRIGRNVWIGANSVIHDGTSIGDNSIVAAGSIVSGRIPENSVVKGDPAKVVFERRE